MAHHAVVDISQENVEAAGLMRPLMLVGLVAGLAGLVVSGLLGLSGGWEGVLRAYLCSFMYFTSLALGGLLFVMIQHATRAGWSVVVRRLAEGVALSLPVLGILGLPLVLAAPAVFPWTDPASLGGEAELVRGKDPYLNQAFLIIRYVACFAIWSGLAWYLWRQSVAQDASGDVNVTHRLQFLSAPAIIVYAFTTSFFAFDMLMSLKPAWYSTIFGVYYFAGAMVGFLALLAVLLVWLQSRGRVTHAVTPEHYHDVGKLLFAFVVFWAYIAFSQYMLIWYANLPEETAWFYVRQQGQWVAWSLVLLFGHFVIPFVGLISRVPKRRKGWLVIGAVWMLVMHWVDLYYLAMPQAGQKTIPLSLADLTTFVGVGGLFVATAAWGLGRARLVPVQDPRLHESLAFENI